MKSLFLLLLLSGCSGYGLEQIQRKKPVASFVTSSLIPEIVECYVRQINNMTPIVIDTVNNGKLIQFRMEATALAAELTPTAEGTAVTIWDHSMGAAYKRVRRCHPR